MTSGDKTPDHTHDEDAETQAQSTTSNLGKKYNVPAYPPPSKDATFKRVWKTLLPEVMANEKFKEGDLLRLETLCELYVEKERLKDILDTIGYTYDQIDAKGVTVKVRPEVQVLARVQSNILLYSKSLGLLLKESKETLAREDEQDEWE